ncbi:hypothetical protein BX600DRAFT_149145 [Xylariales sp. PMI_506]|nr:hypothetical protein BX600DRAFT_149145 [Xylariales sp. PMI_506]
MKIELFIPFLSILSFLAVCFPSAAVYLNPWVTYIESIALGAFFLLLCEFISPSPQLRDVFFATLPVKTKSKDGLGVVSDAMDLNLPVPCSCFPRRDYYRYHAGCGNLLSIHQLAFLCKTLDKCCHQRILDCGRVVHP